MYRFRRAGWKVLFFPGAEVFHVGGASHGGRHVPRAGARPRPLHAEAPRAARGRAGTAAAALVAARARRCSSAASAGASYRDAARWLGSGPTRPLLAPSGDEARRARSSRRARSRSLGIARLLPETGLGLGLRLAAATLVLLVPGMLVARALRRRVRRRALALALACARRGARVRFATGSSLTLALVLLAARRRRRAAVRAAAASTTPRAASSPAGVALGVAALARRGRRSPATRSFHLARVRKLDAFGALALRAVDEFRDGGLHPGYAFPLWHGVPRAGRAARRRRPGARRPARGERARAARGARRLRGGRRALPLARPASRSPCRAGRPDRARTGLRRRLPRARAAGDRGRQLLVPAAIALFFAYLRDPARAVLAALAAAGLGARARPPDLRGLPAGRRSPATSSRGADGARRDALGPAAALAAFSAPTVAVAALAAAGRRGRPRRTRPTTGFSARSRSTRSSSTCSRGTATGSRRRCSARRGRDRDRRAGPGPARRPRAAPALVGVRARRLARGARGDAHVGALRDFADLVSLSQARRAAGFLPFAFALRRRAAVLTRLLARLVLPVALVAGIVLQARLPRRLRLPAPGRAGVRHLVRAGRRRGRARGRRGLLRRLRLERPGALAALAAVLFAVPGRGHGFRHWTTPPAPPRRRASRRARRTRCAATCRERAVVFSDAETSYLDRRLRARLRGHCAAGARRRHEGEPPVRALRDAAEFLRTGDARDPAPLRRRLRPARPRRTKIRPQLPAVWSDGRYRLLRL